MSPGLAFGWHVWTRHRLGLTLCAGYWLLVVIGANVLPLASFPRALPPSLFAVPCVGAFSYLVCIFSFSRETPLETRESGFPTRLLTLPLPTRSLVAWPMLWGTSILASAWLTLTWSVLRIAGDDLGILIWWPALLLAVVLAWLQAIVWSPFPLPWLRAILAAPLVGAPVIVPHILLIAFNIGEGLAAALLAVQLPAAYLIAVRGVSRARRGDMACWTWPGWRAWLRWISATTVNRPFLSPARAQLWFEWRRCGLTFPLMTAVWAIFWVPMIPITVQFIEDAAQGGLALVPPILLHEIGSHWLVVGSLLFFLPLLAAATGLELGKLPGRDRTRRLVVVPRDSAGLRGVAGPRQVRGGGPQRAGWLGRGSGRTVALVRARRSRRGYGRTVRGDTAAPCDRFVLDHADTARWRLRCADVAANDRNDLGGAGRSDLAGGQRRRRLRNPRRTDRLRRVVGEISPILADFHRPSTVVGRRRRRSEKSDGGVVAEQVEARRADPISRPYRSSGGMGNTGHRPVGRVTLADAG